jgi:hypothetical protein
MEQALEYINEQGGLPIAARYLARAVALPPSNTSWYMGLSNGAAGLCKSISASVVMSITSSCTPEPPVHGNRISFLPSHGQCVPRLQVVCHMQLALLRVDGKTWFACPDC